MKNNSIVTTVGALVVMFFINGVKAQDITAGQAHVLVPKGVLYSPTHANETKSGTEVRVDPYLGNSEGGQGFLGVTFDPLGNPNNTYKVGDIDLSVLRLQFPDGKTQTLAERYPDFTFKWDWVKPGVVKAGRGPAFVLVGRR